MLRKKQHKLCKGNSKRTEELKWLKTKHLKRMLLRNRSDLWSFVFTLYLIINIFCYFNIHFNILTTCLTKCEHLDYWSLQCRVRKILCIFWNLNSLWNLLGHVYHVDVSCRILETQRFVHISLKYTGNSNQQIYIISIILDTYILFSHIKYTLFSLNMNFLKTLNI